MNIVLVSSFILAFSLAVSGRGVPERIVGGSDARDGQYPYVVSMKFHRNDKFLCAGTIVNKRWILTSGYCALGVCTLDIDAYPGSVSLDESKYMYETGRCELHPLFNMTDDYDIGLVHIMTDMVFNDKIKPIELAQKDSNLENRSAVVTGWGYTRPEGGMSKILQQLEVKMISYEKCQNYHQNLKGAEVCSVSKKGEGPCYDWGSPLVVDGVQVGVRGFSRNDACANGNPEVYARVSYSYDWIQSVVNSESD